LCDTSHLNIVEYPKMSTLRSISLDLELGQTILVGKKKEPAEITKIEYHEKSGVISLGTTKGPRNALTFSIPAPRELDSNYR